MMMMMMMMYPVFLAIVVLELSWVYPANSFLIPAPTRISSTTSTSTSSATQLSAKRTKKKPKAKSNTICVNRQARRNYEVVETLEAGVSLVGTEVKSIRDGKMNLRDGYVRPTKDGRSCLLYNVHIGKHSMSGAYFQHEERRERRLLVHKNQARKFLQQVDQAGMTIVPLKAYFNDDNKIKIQIALCRGKNVRDKRQDIKNREAKREEQRIIKSFRVA
ncbi:SsrA-binding protein [Seminavis robusta]|uniref:SsrA-binding protein n=1 Tax=Seminavis robusta TaxID=568900 RepID=A0A9N8DCV5_9STRA|nr:SsrA-binding protein [Seminavis robusta]|eukprot:Sro84_g045050.1 SsrA-binding protein (218) ;mRNA; f:111041-111694